MNSGLKLVWSELFSIVNNSNAYGDEPRNNAHQRRSNADLDISVESCEPYLMRVLTNPLSLKQMSRIVVRNRIIDNMKRSEFIRNYVLSNAMYQMDSTLDRTSSPTLSNANALATSTSTPTPHRRTQQTHSILECLIWQLDLPRILHFYLYAFPDVPRMPEDIAVFVND